MKIISPEEFIEPFREFALTTKESIAALLLIDVFEEQVI